MGNLEDLAKNRDALLLAEMGVWLHMLGKFHESFLSGNHDLDIEIPSDIQTQFPQLYNDLTDNSWTGQIWQQLDAIVSELQARDLSIFDIINKHRTFFFDRRTDNINYTNGFLKLNFDAHGRGSNVEKGVLARFASKQEVNVYLSSSLGREPNAFINLTKVQNERKKLYSFLEAKFSTLKARNAKLNHDEWLHFHHDFIQRIKECFSISVAETRRPLNDVTLFDQTAASIAFFKSALAQNLLMGWNDPNQTSTKYHWRLLYIGIDSLDFWDKAVRIGDLLARRDLIKQALDMIQTLIEVTYPLGNEVYRDINGSIFIVPDVANLQNYTANGRIFEYYIQSVADKIFSKEANFTLILSDSTRNTLSFGKLIASVLPPPTPQAIWLKHHWINKQKDVCPVCNSRSQGPSRKALSRKVCDVCQTRRINRSEQWIGNPSTTIWIDEIGDANGQVVLLVAQFDVVDWLSGKTFNSILSIDPKSCEWTDYERDNMKFDFDLHALTTDIQQGLRRSTNPFQRGTLLANLVLRNSRGGTYVQDFYNLRILGTDLEHLSSLSESERLILEMIRLSPSFSRISRVWETTKQFWEGISDAFKTTVYEIDSRIRIRGVPVARTGNGDLLGVSHTYELKLENVNLSVVCTSEGEFLTVDNLRRAATLLGAPNELRKDYDTAATYVNAHLQQAGLVDLEESTGYGSPNRVLASIRIENARTEGTSYVPAVTIVSEPRTFMALLPADKALDVAKAIKTKYEEEMGKVRNRLPLTMGIVFAGIRTPLPSILDTGRRMLKQRTTSSYWKIVKVDPEYPHHVWPDKIKLTLEQDGTPILVKVPTTTGDGKKDVWYPYWCLEEGTPNAKKRERMFKSVDGKPWVHVTDLQEGDTVSFMPSRFDFEFLDAASRRFEVSYDKNGKRRGDTRIARPYYLEQLDEIEELWDILFNGLATSQIHNLIELIEAKRLVWEVGQDKSVFEKMVHDILDNAGWNPRLEEKKFAKLRRAAINGQLTDVVELHLHILKPE